MKNAISRDVAAEPPCLLTFFATRMRPHEASIPGTVIDPYEAQVQQQRLCGTKILAGCDLFADMAFDDPCTEQGGVCTPGAQGFTCGERNQLPAIHVITLWIF